MPIYRRFGFMERGWWKADDGQEHPIGLLDVPAVVMDRVKSVLKRRGLVVHGNLVLKQSQDLSCRVWRERDGYCQLELRGREQP